MNNSIKLATRISIGVIIIVKIMLMLINVHSTENVKKLINIYLLMCIQKGVDETSTPKQYLALNYNSSPMSSISSILAYLINL